MKTPILREVKAAEELPVPLPAAPPRVLEVAAANAGRGIGGAMATVVARHGSAPSTPGQKIYLGRNGECVGTVGGGAVEREVLTALASFTAESEPAEESGFGVRSFALGAELGMCCGGRVEVFFEEIAGLVPCLIVGGGHVASAVAPMLARVGFAVTVVDERAEWTHEGRLEGVRTVCGDFDDVGREMPKSSAVLVMTHDHALDQQVIEWALKSRFAYVGGIGSRAKAERTKARLLAKGFSEADRERVQMPLGVSIGARLPDEIAVSVCAEMVRWRREG